MKRFGYEVEGQMERMLEDETMAVERLLKRFQKHNGLKVSGEQDEETVNLIKMKRCGNKNEISESDEGPTDNLHTSNRRKRYAHSGNFCHFMAYINVIANFLKHQGRNQPSSWGEHENFLTPKRGIFGAVPRLCST